MQTMEKEYFLRIITEICQENDIKIINLDNKRICILSYNGIEKIIWSKKFELNSVTSTKIADNKSSTYQVLHQKNIPCIEYKRYNGYYREGVLCLGDSSLEDINNDLVKYSQMVIKPDNGYEGVDVYRIKKLSDISYYSKKFNSQYKYICTSPYYQIKNEYRTICLNGTALLSYKKTLPFVVGNGIDNVERLIQLEFKSNALKYINQLTKDEKKYIPKLNEEINISWKFNLSQGAESTNIEDENLLYLIQQLSLKAANAIHINFSSVDVIETVNGAFLIMEINSGVVINKFIDHDPSNYKIAKSIYKKAIFSMFNKSGNDR